MAFGKNKKARKVSAKGRKTAVRVVVCVAVLAAAVLPALFVNTLEGYIPLVSCIAAVIICRVYLAIIKSKVTCQLDAVQNSCARWEEISFKVVVANGSFLPVPKVTAKLSYTNLFGKVEEQIEAAGSLASKSEGRFGFKVRFSHVGIYEAGLDELVVSDPLGLFKARMDSFDKQTIEVCPRAYAMEDLELSEVSMVESEDSRTAAFFDSLDYTGVRDYALGDSMRLIHWKLSARTDDYYTKLFESYGVPGITVLMDFNAPYDDAEWQMSAYDGIVETAFSAALLATELGMDFEAVCLNDARERLALEKDVLSEGSSWLSLLPRIGSEGHESDLKELLMEECDPAHGYNNVVVVSAGIDSECAEEILELKAGMKTPAVLAVVPAQVPRRTREELLAPLSVLDVSEISVGIVDPDAESGLGWRQ